MDRLISEKDVLDAIKSWATPLQVSNTEIIQDSWVEDVCTLIKELPPAEPKIVPIANIHIDEDEIRKICKEVVENMGILESRKGIHWKDFARWVANEIFDDEWEYNKDTFPEIACRKLAKLGIVTRMGNEWELVEPQESEG